MSQESDLRDLFKESDIILLDRGFRDAVPKLETEYKLQVKMPALLAKNQKQLDTQQANQSRFGTKCRWVVESRNSGLKRSHKALEQVHNKSLPHTIEDYRIAGSLINAFHDRLISDKQDWKQIVVNMKRLVNTENVLKSLYEEEKLKLKSKYDKLDASEVNDFPKLELDAIKTHITLGIYQITQAKSYIGMVMATILLWSKSKNSA